MGDSLLNGHLTEEEEWPMQEFGDERSRSKGGRCNGSEAAMCWHTGRIAQSQHGHNRGEKVR